MTPMRTERGYVLFDQDDRQFENESPSRLIYLFCNSRQTQSGINKDQRIHTNLVGSGGYMPCGQMLDVKAVRLSAWANEPDHSKLIGTPRVTLRFSAASEGAPPFDRAVEPGELVELGKTIRLWPMECFRVEVSGATAPVRVELHGDFHQYGHTNAMGPDGSRLFMLSEQDVKALTPLVERAIPDTKDKRERQVLSHLYTSLRESSHLLDGSFYAARVIKGEVKILPFQTPDARDAYKKAFADVAELRCDDVRCWSLPEEIESITDEAVQARVLHGWAQVMVPFQEDPRR